jgi:hypothetical protein
LLSTPNGFNGFEVMKTGCTYTPRERHVGRFLRIVNDTVDMVIGEIVRAKPVIMSVEITATDWTVGSTVSLSITHKHVKPDCLQILWIREHNNLQKAIALDVAEYTLTNEDIGYRIRAIATPLDAKRKVLESSSSERSPPIRNPGLVEPVIVGKLKEGSSVSVVAPQETTDVVWSSSSGRAKFQNVGTGTNYTLQNADVGRFLRAVVTLASGRKVVAVTSTTVRECLPSVEISLPRRIVEGQTIVPTKTWRGGTERGSKLQWFRQTNSGWEFVCSDATYQTSLKDVGSIIKLVYAPARNDNVKGPEVEAESEPVSPADPCVENVAVCQNGRGFLQCTGDYFGGVEGLSFIVWRVYENDKPQNIGKSIERELNPEDICIGKTVDAVYVPIRADGTAGPPVASGNKVVVEPLPVVKSAEILVKHGKLNAGNLMRCRVKVSPGAKAKFQWLHGDGTAWEVIDGATTAEYQPGDDDIGFLMLCCVTAVNAKGWESGRFSASTATPVAPHEKRLDLDEANWFTGGDKPKVIAGVLLSTKLKLESLAKAKLTWQRKENGVWANVKADDVYQVTCNDIGHRLRAIAANGLTSAHTNVVEGAPALCSYVRAQIRTKVLTFVAASKLGGVVWHVAVSAEGVVMTNRNGSHRKSNWKRVSCEAVDATIDELVLWMDPATKFVLVPSLNDARLEGLVGKQNVRDFVVMVVNGIKNAS